MQRPKTGRQRLGRNSCDPHKVSELFSGDGRPIGGGQLVGRKQEVGCEGVSFTLGCADVPLGAHHAPVAENQVAEFVGHVPVLPEPVSGGRDRDHRAAGDVERVGGTQTVHPNDVDLEAIFDMGE